MVATVTTKVRILPEQAAPFATWQSDLNVQIASFPGFVSLEILSLNPSADEWTLVERFHTEEQAALWHDSQPYHELINRLRALTHDEKDIQEIHELQKGGVTEVIVTHIPPHQEKAYRNWIGKIHAAEAKFPGFKGVFVQSPTSDHDNEWITLLQFDTAAHLDHWLESKERQKILKEGKGMITSLQTHQVTSSYAGWFSSLAPYGALPSVWKQSMIVLLVLFPVVVLEMKYLSPLLTSTNPSLAIFLSNALGVTLLAWPLVPLAITCLSWWLNPRASSKGKRLALTVVGTGVVLVLYVIEIVLF